MDHDVVVYLLHGGHFLMFQICEPLLRTRLLKFVITCKMLRALDKRYINAFIYLLFYNLRFGRML